MTAADRGRPDPEPRVKPEPEQLAAASAAGWDAALAWIGARRWDPHPRVPILELLAAEAANPYRTQDGAHP